MTENRQLAVCGSRSDFGDGRWARSCAWSRGGGRAVDDIAKFLARLEEGDSLGRHLHPVARFGIASDASLALPGAETAEAANLDLVSGAERFHDAVEDC